eukprot:768431-Hanusia_phi.AAC.19
MDETVRNAFDDYRTLNDMIYGKTISWHPFKHMRTLAILNTFLLLNTLQAQKWLQADGQCNDQFWPDSEYKTECIRLCETMRSNAVGSCADKIAKLYNITSRVGQTDGNLSQDDLGILARDLFYKEIGDSLQIDSCFANIQADWVARDFACIDHNNVLRRLAVQLLPYRYYDTEARRLSEVLSDSFCITTMSSMKVIKPIT